MVILDTCALIESCKEEQSFSKKTLMLLKEPICILSISFAEIACKMKIRKLQMDKTVTMLYDELSEYENVEIANIGVTEWLDSIDLDWPDNKDPADRMIVAFAMRKNLSIVTSDKKIKHFYKNVIW